MLDASLPTFTHQPSAENPLNTILYFTHNGSEPSAEYLLKRPSPSESRNQYALGLLDVHCKSVIYAEVVAQPEWTQPTLSAAELRAQNGAPASISASASASAPLMPEAFDILLYNPDQAITVKRHHGSWGKSETWEFEVPERSFKVPSASEIDKDSTPALSELAPKVVFRWKRDGRLSRDMSCYMSGRSVGGNKSKEPDITVALFRAGKSGSVLTIYEPNMARVDVEDRKGLEVALILSAEVVRDLHLVPKHDPFNIAGGGSAPGTSKAATSTSSSQQHQQAAVPQTIPQTPAPAVGPGFNQAQVDAETKRIQAMAVEENRLAREREKRDKEEQNRIRKMLEREEKERRRREAEVEKETERLRKQYGVKASPSPQQQTHGSPQGYSTSPTLPPRPGQNHHPCASGALGWGGQTPGLPPRPNSTGPRPTFSGGGGVTGGKKKQKKHSNPLGALLSPYAGASGASISGFFHRSDDKRRQADRKRSF